MKRWIALLPMLALAGGCKGKVEYRDNPECKTALDGCERNLGEKATYIKDLEARIVELEKTAGPENGEVVVNIKGPLPEDAILEIKGGAGPNVRTSPKEPKGNAKDEALYAEFIGAVKKSRGSIRKCYQNALKKDTRLQSKTVTVNIAVSYRTSGNVSGTNVTPTISQQFERCMGGVAERWKLPAMPRAVSFNYRQTLTPE